MGEDGGLLVVGTMGWEGYSESLQVKEGLATDFAPRVVRNDLSLA